MVGDKQQLHTLSIPSAIGSATFVGLMFCVTFNIDARKRPNEAAGGGCVCGLMEGGWRMGKMCIRTIHMPFITPYLYFNNVLVYNIKYKRAIPKHPGSVEVPGLQGNEECSICWCYKAPLTLRSKQLICGSTVFHGWEDQMQMREPSITCFASRVPRGAHVEELQQRLCCVAGYDAVGIRTGRRERKSTNIPGIAILEVTTTHPQHRSTYHWSHWGCMVVQGRGQRL